MITKLQSLDPEKLGLGGTHIYISLGEGNLIGGLAVGVGDGNERIRWGAGEMC